MKRHTNEVGENEVTVTSELHAQQKEQRALESPTEGARRQCTARRVSGVKSCVELTAGLCVSRYYERLQTPVDPGVTEDRGGVRSSVCRTYRPL